MTMTTTTTSTVAPVLPTTRRQLDEWMPTEPDTSVTRARAAVATITSAITATTTWHTQLVADHKRAAAAVADAAYRGDNITPLVDLLGNGADLTAATHRLAQLRAARRIAQHRVTAAERDDAGYAAWRRTCASIQAEWDEAMDADDPANALLDFVHRHGA